MATEIERKFLVLRNEWSALKKPIPILCMQCYLSDGVDPTIRIRVMGERGFLTVKGKNKGISRPEFEYEIPVADAREMMDKFGVNMIRKERYIIKHHKHNWEVDVFHGENEGLIIAELELWSECETYTSPEWLGEEVSSDPRYYNVNLQTNPYTKWNVS